MDNETLKAIMVILKGIAAKPDGAVTAAMVTVCGMITVATLTTITQWIVTKRLITSEHNKISIQINSEFKLRQFENWQSDFKEAISLLLAATDPEIRNPFNKSEIVPLVHKIQLMLNLNHPGHRKVNELLNSLTLSINGWHQRVDEALILRTHGQLLDACKEILYLPPSN